MKVRVLNSQTSGEINELNLAMATRLQGECLIGRSPSSALVLDTPDVSRIHGKFFIEDGQYYFCDLGSRNGSIVNGELAGTNQNYMLKNGDTVRIGEFVLIVEEVSEIPQELPETVFGVIDATVISGWRSATKLNTPEANQAPPAREPKLPLTPEVIIVSKEIQQDPKVVTSESQLATDESEPVAQVPEKVSEAPEDASSQESTTIQTLDEVEIPEARHQSPELESDISEQTYIQANEAFAPPSAPEEEAVSEATAIQPPEAVSEALEVAEDSESTYIQVPSEADREAAVFEVLTPPEEIQEISDVPHPTFEAAESRDSSASATGLVEEGSEPATQVAEEESEAVEVVTPVSETSEETVIQEEEEAVAVSEIIVIQPLSEETDQTLEVAEETEATYIQVPSEADQEAVFETLTPVTEATNLQEATTIQSSEVAESEASNDSATGLVEEVAAVTQRSAGGSSGDSVEQAQEESEAPEEVQSLEIIPSHTSEVPEVTSIQDLEEAEFDTSATEPEEFAEAAVSEVASTQVHESVGELEETPQVPEADYVQTSEAIAHTSTVTEAPREAEVPEVIAQTPEAVNKAFEIISKKYIALMAHDNKKSELAQFVTQHQDFLSKCLTVATPSISETLHQQTSVAISQKTPSVPIGGYQTIASLVGTGDILAVIFLRDFLTVQPSQANEEALLRLCNINQILLATNVPTAEAVMHYIKDMVTSL